jgi:hypothetical protein
VADFALFASSECGPNSKARAGVRWVGSVAKLAMINKRNPKEVHDEFKYFSEKSAALGHNS